MPSLNDLVADAKSNTPEMAETVASGDEQDFELLDQHQGEVKVGVFRILKLAESLAVCDCRLE